MNIGRRVREVREDLGMQRTVLARRVGVAENTIYRIETGKRAPSVELLENIARELRTDPAEFLREPVLLGKAEDPDTGRPADEYEEVLIPRTSLSDTDASQSALKFLFDYVGTYQDRVEDLSGRIEDGYIEVGLKTQGSGPQVIRVARGDEPEEAPLPELRHDIDAAFDRIVATLRDAGVEEEFIDEYDGPVRRRALAEVARA
jgi:transcriptional regulator with XRE-family HTH domain